MSRAVEWQELGAPTQGYKPVFLTPKQKLERIRANNAAKAESVQKKKGTRRRKAIPPSKEMVDFITGIMDAKS